MYAMFSKVKKWWDFGNAVGMKRVKIHRILQRYEDIFHEACVCVSEYMFRQAGVICSSQCPRSNQSVNTGGARLISQTSSISSLVSKTDALGNKTNQYTSSQSSPPAQSQDIVSICHQPCHLFLSGITILFTW